VQLTRCGFYPYFKFLAPVLHGGDHFAIDQQAQVSCDVGGCQATVLNCLTVEYQVEFVTPLGSIVGDVLDRGNAAQYVF